MFFRACWRRDKDLKKLKELVTLYRKTSILSLIVAKWARAEPGFCLSGPSSFLGIVGVACPINETVQQTKNNTDCQTSKEEKTNEQK